MHAHESSLVQFKNSSMLIADGPIFVSEKTFIWTKIIECRDKSHKEIKSFWSNILVMFTESKISFYHKNGQILKSSETKHE